jgi:transposase
VFFRTKSSPSGQCVQLLEAYRNAQGAPRQRVVISLGNASIGEADRRAVAAAVGQSLYGQTELLPPEHSPEVRRWIDRILKEIEREGRWRPASAASAGVGAGAVGETLDGVVLAEVGHTHTAPLGPSLVGLAAWNRLGMPGLLERLGFNAAQREAAAITVIHRLARPGSERSLVEWLPDSSLPELMGVKVTAAGKDRFYRVSDKLLARQAAIERHLRDWQGRLFGGDRTILLYDLTNSYFEGEAERNPKAKRGNSKEKRGDCPQIVVGMVFDRRGFELAHKVFAGNQSDGKSLVAMIEELQALIPAGELPPPRTRPLVIVDAGVATRQNLQLLRDNQLGYLVNDSRRGRGRYRAAFLEEDQFKTIAGREGKAPVKVRLIRDPEDPRSQAAGKRPSAAATLSPGASAERPAPASGSRAGDGAAGAESAPASASADYLILCKSQGRRDKELAIRTQAEARYEAALKKLAERVGHGKLRALAKAQRAVGRIQQRHPRVQRYYEVVLQTEGALSLSWRRWEQDYKADEALLGCYVLRTDQPAQTAEEVWELYTTLSKAEDGFKALKSDLGLRPNYHQKELRVDGHVFISVLAYHLLWYILEMLAERGVHQSWETIKRLLQTHCYTTILLPTKGGKLYRVRKAGQPEECQAAIYRNLRIEWGDLPCTKVVVEREKAAKAAAKK